MRASQLWQFFCVVSPGHEAQALEEFQAKRSMLSTEALEARAIPGGFEVHTTWEIGRGLVHVLKIPTRVVIRLTTFTARDFPKMFNTVCALPLTQWLQHPAPKFRITAHQCRLMHTGRVEETLQDALKAAHERQPFSTRYRSENLPQDLLLLRGDNDQWTLSLDLAGDALYKRHEAVSKNEAPIRETHAAAALWSLFKDYSGEPITLIDPMCGSGTLLREALGFFEPSARPFAYLTSPVNKGVHPWRPKTKLAPWPIAGAQGLDINEALISEHKKTSLLDFGVHDLLSSPFVPSAGPRWIVCNPPYGERLELAGGTQDFADKLSRALSLYSPARVALIVPRSFPSIRVANLKVRAQHPFSNGGIPVEVRVFS